MNVGDLITHKNYPRSMGIITETMGQSTLGNPHPPAIRVQWITPPSPHFVDLIGSVWLRRITCK